VKSEEYIKGMLQHDSWVLSKIYEDFASRIKNMILQKGGTADDAKDIFHDALIVIYQKAHSPDFELTATFYTYLYSICRFMWDRKRKKKANNTVTIPDDNGLIIDESILEDILLREKQKVFKDNLSKLGETCQKILRLFFIRKSMREIAETLQFENEHIARTRKYRCTKELEKMVRADSRYAELESKNLNTNPE